MGIPIDRAIHSVDLGATWDRGGPVTDSGDGVAAVNRSVYLEAAANHPGTTAPRVEKQDR